MLLQSVDVSTDLIKTIVNRWVAAEEKNLPLRTMTATDFLAQLAGYKIELGYRQTVEPPGVEVWAYYGEGNYGAPGASPLGAILSVGFAKFQGRHSVWRLRKRLMHGPEGTVGLFRRVTVGDTFNLPRGQTVALGRAIRQALDVLYAEQRVQPAVVIPPPAPKFAGVNDF